MPASSLFHLWFPFLEAAYAMIDEAVSAFNIRSLYIYVCIYYRDARHVTSYIARLLVTLSAKSSFILEENKAGFRNRPYIDGYTERCHKAIDVERDTCMIIHIHACQ